jgi:dihydroorotate dehydrogenase
MYKLIKPILFLFDAETVHQKVMKALVYFYKLPFGPFILSSLYDFKHPKLEKEVFGLRFKNTIGLAAGFDKNGAYIDELAALGFGFVEVGTVTPQPQDGNPKPRLFRLISDHAIINRMGFNNHGVNALVGNLKRVKNKEIIIGGNIGKNKNTPNENAVHDYTFCTEKLYDYVHYFVINVSSPNTPGLRDLQEKGPLTEIIESMVAYRKNNKKYKPILLKVAPDLTHGQLDDIAEITNNTGLDGLIVSNTTIERKDLKADEKELKSLGAGGLSGIPLLKSSNEVLHYLSQKTKKPIIGVGGIETIEDVQTKIKNGASLVQVYTGFIYQGPGMIKKINKGLLG